MNYSTFRCIIFLTALALSSCVAKRKQPTNLGDVDGLNTTGIFSVSSEESKVQYAFIIAEGLFLNEEYQECKVQLQELIQKKPKTAAFHYKLSQCDAQLFDLKAAIVSAEKALSLETSNPVYYQYLSDLYHLDDQWEQAAKTYEKMVLTVKGQEQYNLRIADIYMDLGKAKYDQRNYHIQNPSNLSASAIRKLDDQIHVAHLKAIKALGDYEQFFGFNADVVQKKRSLYLIENKVELAKVEGQKLINSNPENPEYWLSQSSIIEQVESNQAGIKYLENALPGLKQTGLIRLRLAQLYRKIGDQKESDRQLSAAFESEEMPFDEKIKMLSGILGTNQKAMKQQGLRLAVGMTELYPNNPESYSVLGDAYMVNEQPEQAREAYQKILLFDQGKPQVYDQLILLDSVLNDYSSQANHAQSAIENLDNPSKYYLSKVRALVKLEQYQAAKRALEDGRETNRDQKEFYQLLAKVNVQLSLYQEAYTAYDDLLEFNPNDYSIINEYAYLIAETKGDLDMAKAQMEKLTRIFPQNPDYLHTYAWVLYQANERLSSASEMIQKSVSIKPSKTAYEHGALILQKNGQSDLAQQFREKTREF